MHYQYLIIGGGIAGVTAAETVRQHNPDATIAIVGSEAHVIYSRVLLPAFLKKRIPRTALFLRTVEDFTAKKIVLYQQETLISIDVKHKDVVLENGKTFQYDKLLLATGGNVKPWGKPEDQHIIYRLQTLDDADRLSEHIPTITNPLVVGASFISLELLEIFLANHIVPTLLVRDSHFFGSILEEQGGALMQQNFDHLGIKTHYHDTIATIEYKERGAEITTKTLKKMSCDAIGVGIGIDRDFGYAQSAGIDVGQHGILTNEYLETNQPDVFACGDVAEFYDGIADKQHTVGNWTNAVLQGKRAGLNMLGQREKFTYVPSYSITNLGFQITAVGDCSRHEGAIVRVDPVHKQYERFFFKEDVLAGAILINRFADKAHIAMLIENRTHISQWRKQLADMAFDIHAIKMVA